MRSAIYCRVSSPGQRNTTSLPEQERINRGHAATLAWDVSEPHVYREVEGGEDLYRPCMDRLWDAIQAHEIDAVVIDVLDRLTASNAWPVMRFISASSSRSWIASASKSTS